MSKGAEAAAAGPLGPGDEVPGYRILGVLGSGGAGFVYEGIEEATGARVALKVLSRTAAEDPAGALRFERESRIARDVGHPGVVPIRAFGATRGGHPFGVMDLLRGRDLGRTLAERGRLPPEEAMGIVREVAEVLAAVHRAGVVHRDLKPRNVFLEEGADGGRVSVRVLDFGVARADGPEAGPVTITGAPVGTPSYMPPEQWWGRGVDRRADVYALGAMWFELLAGAPPFVAEGYVDLLQAHLSRPAPRLSDRGVAVAGEVESLVARMLAKDPSERPASMEEVLAALPGGKAPPRPAPPRWRASAGRAGIWAAMAGLVLGIGYRGEHAPAEIARLGGWGAWAVMAAFAVIAAASAARAGRERGGPGAAGVAAAGIPWALGLLGAFTGWAAIRAHSAELDPAARFLVFQAGSSETHAARFLGGAATAALLLSLGVAPGERRKAGARSRWRGVAGVLAAAGFGAWAGGGGGALVAAVGAGAWLAGAALHPGRDAATRGLATVAAVGASAAAALAREDAAAAGAWIAGLDRAARSEAVVALARRREAVLALSAFALAVVAWGVFGKVRASFEGAGPGEARRIRRAAGIAAASLCLAAGGEGALVMGLSGERARLWSALAPQFAAWSHLDPPTGRAPPPAAVAPAVQIGRQAVFVDGERIATVAALEVDGGPAPRLLAGALAPRLAGPGERPEGAAGLLLAADRSLPFRVVETALAAARSLGVTEVDALTVPGPPPRVPPRAPPEATYVVPGDLGAVRVRLIPADPGTGATPDPAEPWGAVLLRLSGAGGDAELEVRP